MKYGITVQHPPRCGSRWATFGTDISYENFSALNNSWLRYRIADRKPRLPNATPNRLICAADSMKILREEKRCPSCFRSCTLTSNPRDLIDVNSSSPTTYRAPGISWNEVLIW